MRSIKNPIRTLFSLSFGAAALCLCIHCGHGGGDSNPGNGITGHAYVADGGNTISIYTLGATGALKPMTTLTAGGLGSHPSTAAIAFDPSSKYAYVVNINDETVSAYTIGSDGGLTAIPSATVPTGSVPRDIAIAVNASGKYAYVTNAVDQNVSQYSINSDGTLTSIASAIRVTTVGGPELIVADPSGRFVYVSIDNGNIVQLTIGTDGTLASPTTFPAGLRLLLAQIWIDRSGNYLYAAGYADYVNPGNVLWFTIGTTGALSSPATVSAGILPGAMAIDPTGRYAYVVNENSANISQYTIGTYGALTPMAHPTVAAGTAGTDNPYKIAIDPSGKCVYVVNALAANGTVFQYSIGAGGELAPMAPPTVAAGSYAGAIAILGR